MAQQRGPSVFPIDLQTVLGDALRLSPSTVGSPIGLKNSLELRHIGFPNRSSNRTRRRPDFSCNLFLFFVCVFGGVAFWFLGTRSGVALE